MSLALLIPLIGYLSDHYDLPLTINLNVMNTFKSLFLIVLGLLSSNILAQDEDIYVQGLVEGNREEIEALSLYPDDIREAIFEACLHPELLVKIGGIQSHTKEAFYAVINNYNEDEQREFWELLRYSGLVEELLQADQNRSSIQQALEGYPEEIQTLGAKLGMSKRNALQQINDIDKKANGALQSILTSYDQNTRDRVNLLLQFPEVLHILVEQIELAILIGEAYQKHPEKVIAQADSIKMVVTRRNAEDIEAWKKGLEENPEALAEFEEVSQRFKEENKYSSEYDPMYPSSSVPGKEVKEQDKEDVHVEYNYYPYPYWYGYPGWFPNVYWYYYPYWYHWGYYYGRPRSIVVLGLPSYFYFYWYFQVPSNYYRYPYLSDYIIQHYRVRRGVGPSRSGLNRSVESWRRRNGNRVPDRVLNEKDPAIRRQKIREYGRFEESYRRSYKRKPNETGTRDNYLQRRSGKYPYLSGQKRAIKERTSQPRTSSGSRINGIRPSRSMELNRAREQHQRTWDRSNYNRNRRSSTPRTSGTIKRRKRN